MAPRKESAVTKNALKNLWKVAFVEGMVLN
jgi:hypothetical protein